METILVINPGATSTKVAVFTGETGIFQTTVEHSDADLAGFGSVFEQYPYRLEVVLASLRQAGIALEGLTAVAGRGGLLKPLAGGTYAVNQLMVNDLQSAERGEHASNLGGVMAYNLAQSLGIPAYITNPVTVDEFDPVARISGLPELERQSFSHALNMKAVAKRLAAEMGKSYAELNVIVAHLGTGVSVTPHTGGRMIDVNNAMEEGPFSLDRCGGLPASQLVKLCYSGKYTFREMKEKLVGKGGVYAYLGTKDVREIEARAAQGDIEADQVLTAFTYQVAKEIGAMAAVLCGKVERIILTGGIANSQRVVGAITQRVEFIAPVVVMPGEGEMEALAAGAFAALTGREQAQEYR